MMMMIKAALLCLFFMLAGCGYNMGYEGLPKTYRTINIPYIDGDFEGDLNSTIIEQISQSGAFEYRNCSADLTLLVKILNFNDENIGFRYDRHKDGRLRDTIIPTETRQSVLAEIAVVENSSGKTLLGPVKLSASVDFDHDYYSCRNEINVFSLGQLIDFDAADDIAKKPLNLLLAKKIIEYICDNW